jgi:hypothetical protein
MRWLRSLLRKAGRAQSTTPHAVERGDKPDVGEPDSIRGHEVDRSGMRIWRTRRKDGDEPAAFPFCLNADLPADVRLDQNLAARSSSPCRGRMLPPVRYS